MNYNLRRMTGHPQRAKYDARPTTDDSRGTHPRQLVNLHFFSEIRVALYIYLILADN